MVLTLTVVLVASVGTAACSHSHAASGIHLRDGFAGWWTNSNSDFLHIVFQDGQYAIVSTNPQERPTALSSHNGTLRSEVSPEGRTTLALSADGARLEARFSQGKFTMRTSYRRATPDEINSFLAQSNGSRLAAAIRNWRWAVGSYPTVADVVPGGALQRQLEPWPTNPYSGKPMAPGTQLGEYRYHFTNRGCTLKVVTADGGVVFQADAPGSLSAVVTATHGSFARPAANAKVLVRLNFGSTAKPDWVIVATARTGSDGHFATTVNAGTYMVTATLKGVGRSVPKSVIVRRGGHSHVMLVISTK